MRRGIDNVMVAMDGNRRIATARYTPAGYPGLKSGWLCKAFGFSWTDPRAREPNRITGKPDPRFILVRTKREARRLIRGVEAGAHRRNVT